MDEVKLYEAFDEDPTPIVEFLRWLVHTHHVQEPPCVLDVGCGLGRMFAPLSEKGWHVTGLEPNDAFLDMLGG
jgi:SAM-dependent methyltransferase